jgi:uncharacterized membrane protein YsdA (DUF1294 family)
MTFNTQTWLTAFILTLNLIIFTAFAIDKAQARVGRRRISETTLLALALLGGTPAAYAARHLFGHKTRKQPFVRQLHTIALIQLAGLGALVVMHLRG